MGILYNLYKTFRSNIESKAIQAEDRANALKNNIKSRQNIQNSISGFQISKNNGTAFVVRDKETRDEIVDSRYRGLTNNTPSLKAGVDRLASLVVGVGNTGKVISWENDSKNKKISKELDKINRAWKTFTESCGFIEDETFEHLQYVAFRDFAFHGECFIIKKFKSYKTEKKKKDIRLKIQIFPKSSLRNELTMINTNNEQNNVPGNVDFESTQTMNKEGRLKGNYTLNGIVYSVEGIPIAYLFWQTINGYNRDGQILEIPAEDVIHFYLHKDSDSRRGEGLIKGAGYILKYMDDTLKSVAEKINLDSKFTYALETSLDNQNSIDRTRYSNLPSGAINAQDAFSMGALINNEAELSKQDPNNEYARTIGVDLKPGQTIRQFTVPDFGDFPAFMKIMNENIANAMGIPYELISGDWSQLNYSGGKAVFELFKKKIELLQHHLVIGKICARTAEWFLEYYELNNSDVDFEEIKPRFKWFSPSLGSLDPVKDVEASISKIKHGLMAPSEYVESEGKDWNDVLKETDKNKKQLEKLGIDIYQETSKADENSGLQSGEFHGNQYTSVVPESPKAK